ncbi:MAG: hypothetical protein WDW38_008135 [Sanguina aurantia]
MQRRRGPRVSAPPPRPNHHTYKLAVKRWLAQSSTDRRRNKRSRGAAADPDTTNRADGPSFAVQLCLWTMSPAVVFAPLAAKTHSVVLTSGTLSPLESFAGELGVAFPTRLEANHVIDMRRQVWPAVIPCCPSGSLLCATYSHTSQVRFQDELGGAVRALCGVIPDGVLLFLPSYGVMDVLVSRWQASEGIDFKDRNARGVLLVGIPYPGARDSKVMAKKAYNGGSCSRCFTNSRGAIAQGGGGGGGSGHGRKVPEGPLSGDKWYQQQGFRALNQAVGRCIRHKLDWGAIVLLDERFREDRNQRGLSKWVRGNLMAFNAFEPALTSLRGFFKELEAHPPVAPPKPALPPTPVRPRPHLRLLRPATQPRPPRPPSTPPRTSTPPAHQHHTHPHQHQHQHPPVPNNHNWGAPLTPVNTTAGQHLKRERDATPPHAGGGAGGGAGGQSERGITREGFGGGGTPEPGDRLEPAAAAWHHELQQRQHEQLQQRQHEQQRQQQQGVKEETGGGKGGAGGRVGGVWGVKPEPGSVKLESGGVGSEPGSPDGCVDTWEGGMLVRVKAARCERSRGAEVVGPWLATPAAAAAAATAATAPPCTAGCSLHPGVTGSLLPEGKGAGVQQEKESCGRCGSTAGNSTMLASEHHAQQRRQQQQQQHASGASSAQDSGSQGPPTGGAVRRRAVVGTGGGRQSKLDFSKAKTSATTTPTGSGLATPITSAHGSGPAGVGHDPPAGPTGPRPAAWTQGSGPTGGGWHVTGGTAASTPCGPSTSGPQGLSHQPVTWGPSQQQPGPWNQGPASSLAQSGARALAWGMPAGDAGATPTVTLGRADQALGSDSGYGSVSIGRQLQYGTSQTQLSPVQLQLSGGRPQQSMGQPQPPVSQRLPGSSHPQRLTHPQQLASSAGRTHIKCEYEEQGAEQHTRHATGFASASNLAQQQQQQQQRRQEPWGSTQHMPRRQSQAGPAHSCHTPEHRPQQQQHQQGQQSQLQPHQNNTPNLHHNQQQNYHASPQQPAGGWQQQQQQQTSDQPNAGQQRNFAHHSPSSYTSPQQPPLQQQQQQQSAQQGFLVKLEPPGQEANTNQQHQPHTNQHSTQHQSPHVSHSHPMNHQHKSPAAQQPDRLPLTPIPQQQQQQPRVSPTARSEPPLHSNTQHPSNAHSMPSPHQSVRHTPPGSNAHLLQPHAQPQPAQQQQHAQQQQQLNTHFQQNNQPQHPPPMYTQTQQQQQQQQQQQLQHHDIPQHNASRQQHTQQRSVAVPTSGSFSPPPLPLPLPLSCPALPVILNSPGPLTPLLLQLQRVMGLALPLTPGQVSGWLEQDIARVCASLEQQFARDPALAAQHGIRQPSCVRRVAGNSLPEFFSWASECLQAPPPPPSAPSLSPAPNWAGPLPLGWTHLITSPALSDISSHLASRSQPTWAGCSRGLEREQGRIQELVGAVGLMGQLYTQAVQVLETGNTGHAPHPPATAAPHNGPVAAGVGPVHTAVLTDVTHNAMNRGVGVQSPGDRPPTGRHSVTGSVVAGQQGPASAASPAACVTGQRGFSASPQGRQAMAGSTPHHSGSKTLSPVLAEEVIPQQQHQQQQQQQQQQQVLMQTGMDQWLQEQKPEDSPKQAGGACVVQQQQLQQQQPLPMQSNSVQSLASPPRVISIE